MSVCRNSKVARQQCTLCVSLFSFDLSLFHSNSSDLKVNKRSQLHTRQEMEDNVEAKGMLFAVLLLPLTNIYEQS